MPNNLPLNWCECKLGDVFHTSSGGTPSRRETAYYGGNIPWLKSGELNDGIISEAEEFITKEGLENSSAKIFPKGSILLALYGATVGKIGILDFDSATNQAVCCIYSNPYFDKNLLFYYLLSQRKHLINQGKGGAQPNISQDIVKNIVLPLPPLAEQERIVEKIEALFAGIDEGVEHLKSAQAQIKQYRQSVLKSAFCFQNNYFCYLKDYIEKPRYGTSKKCSIDLKNSTPVYRIPNINFLKGIIDKSELKYAVFDDTEKKSLSLQKGDILLIRSNGSLNLVGRAALIHDNDINGLFAGYLIRIRVADYTILNPEFLLYYLNSPKARTYIEEKAKSTSGVNNINSEEISELEIPLPTLPEQQRIVEEIEKRFAVADELEKAVNDGLEKADKLKQSILKKAFEGKLVAQNPNDEPASVLLERIKKEQKPTKGKKK